MCLFTLDCIVHEPLNSHFGIQNTLDTTQMLEYYKHDIEWNSSFFRLRPYFASYRIVYYIRRKLSAFSLSRQLAIHFPFQTRIVPNVP